MKKFLSVCLAVLLAVSSFASMSMAVFADGLAGDLDGDGWLTAADARLAYQAAIDKTDVSDNVAFACVDTNGNGKITAGEAREVLRASAGNETNQFDAPIRMTDLTGMTRTEDIFVKQTDLVFAKDEEIRVPIIIVNTKQSAIESGNFWISYDTTMLEFQSYRGKLNRNDIAAVHSVVYDISRIDGSIGIAFAAFTQVNDSEIYMADLIFRSKTQGVFGLNIVYSAWGDAPVPDNQYMPITVKSNSSEEKFTYNMRNDGVVVERCDQDVKGDIVIPETVNGYPVTEIAPSAFAYCDKIESITVPDSVQVIGENAFSDCVRLKSIRLPKGLKWLNYGTFNYCPSLISVEIPDGTGGIGMGVFYGCSSLEKIVIPASVAYIDSHPFIGCDNLRSITVDERNQYYVSENGVLFNKDKTTLIKYPAQKNERSYFLPNSVKMIESYAFSGCSWIDTVMLPDSLKTIGEGAFSGCAQLDYIIIPDSVTHISPTAFYDCLDLRTVTIPADLTELSYGLFQNCKELREVRIPIGVKFIDFSVFDGCNESLRILYEGSESDWQAIDSDNAGLIAAEFLYNQSFSNVDERKIAAKPGFNIYTQGNYIIVPADMKVGDFKKAVENTVEVVTKQGWLVGPVLDFGTVTKDTIVQVKRSDGFVIAEYTVVIALDVDQSEKITAADARLVLRASAMLETLDAEQRLAADANNDGIVNAADARKILRISAGLEKY